MPFEQYAALPPLPATVLIASVDTVNFRMRELEKSAM